PRHGARDAEHVAVLPGPPAGDLRVHDGAVAMSDDDLLARTREALPAWLAIYYDEPIELVRGEGARVWDGSGKEYLDFFGGIVTTISGHVVPKLVEALTEQANKIAHTSTVYLIRPMVQLAERLTKLSPVEPTPVKAFFVGSGTEA